MNYLTRGTLIALGQVMNAFLIKYPITCKDHADVRSKLEAMDTATDEEGKK